MSIFPGTSSNSWTEKFAGFRHFQAILNPMDMCQLGFLSNGTTLLGGGMNSTLKTRIA
jgi:hypothetical protein